MEIEVRVGTSESPVELDSRETKYLIVRSQPYRQTSTGSVGVSGLESVAVPPESGTGTVAIPPGDYAVTVHLIAWDEEPGMQTDSGPAPGALPDYIVLVNPASAGTTFRTAVKTFDKG